MRGSKSQSVAQNMGFLQRVEVRHVLLQKGREFGLRL